eukprot:scaffold70774_cov22-Cyclotella_meneghiniana.AAC.1
MTNDHQRADSLFIHDIQGFTLASGTLRTNIPPPSVVAAPSNPRPPNHQLIVIITLVLLVILGRAIDTQGQHFRVCIPESASSTIGFGITLVTCPSIRLRRLADDGSNNDSFYIQGTSYLSFGTYDDSKNNNGVAVEYLKVTPNQSY